MKKLKLSLFIVVFLMVSLISVNVKAASLVFTPEASKKTLKEGEEVTITLKLSNIDMGEDGINTFGGKLIYDEDVFEKVTESSFSSQNNWSIAYNGEETDKKGTFLATINSGAKTDQIVGTIKLKVKTNLQSTTTKIQFSEVSSVAEDTVDLPSKVVELSIEGTKKAPTTNNNSTLNIVTNSETSSKTNTQTSGTSNKTNTQTTGKTNTQKDNTTSTGRLPQTGVTNLYLSIAIIALGVIAIASYVNYRKNNLK